MTTRIQDNQFKGVIFTILFITLILQTLITNAQIRNTSEKAYKGFLVSFRTRSIELSSPIEAINQSTLLQKGGQVGLVYGNSIVRARVGLLGYYSSTGNTTGTTDLYESNIAFNVYPLSVTSKGFVVNPYITGGLAYDQFKFYGYYLNREPGETNYSQTEAPYLGKIKQVNATFGAGIEVSLKDEYDFIHIFSEVLYGRPVSTKANDAAFAGTQMTNHSQLVIGVTFGAHR